MNEIAERRSALTTRRGSTDRASVNEPKVWDLVQRNLFNEFIADIFRSRSHSLIITINNQLYVTSATPDVNRMQLTRW